MYNCYISFQATASNPEAKIILNMDNELIRRTFGEPILDAACHSTFLLNGLALILYLDCLAYVMLLLLAHLLLVQWLLEAAGSALGHRG